MAGGLLLSTATFAAATALVVSWRPGLGTWFRSTPVVDSRALALGDGGGPIEAGMRLAARASREVRAAGADGTEIIVEPGGALTVVENGATRRFALMHGAVSAHVARLAPGERFIVETSDAEVEVRGTRFRVVALDEPPCADGAATRVAVSEGVVVVTWSGHRESLQAGETWPPECPAASALEAQNDLFAAAVRAKREGQNALAATLFARFIRVYPDSSLFESALVQQMRLLAMGDPRAAASAAVRYLARFPDGFARDEARRLAGVTGTGVTGRR